MKRVLGILILFAYLFCPATIFAADDKIGVYVAPKLTLALVMMSDVKLYGAGYGGGVLWEKRASGSESSGAFGGGLAAGYDFSRRFDVPVRAELEYSMFSNTEVKNDTGGATLKQEFAVKTLLVNAYYDFKLHSAFTPYVGLGLGMGTIDTKWSGSGYGAGGSTESTVNNFVWALGGGVGYAVNETLTLDAGCRWVGLGAVETNTYSGADLVGAGKTGSLNQLEFKFGLRLTF